MRTARTASSSGSPLVGAGAATHEAAQAAPRGASPSRNKAATTRDGKAAARDSQASAFVSPREFYANRQAVRELLPDGSLQPGPQAAVTRAAQQRDAPGRRPSPAACGGHGDDTAHDALPPFSPGTYTIPSGFIDPSRPHSVVVTPQASSEGATRWCRTRRAARPPPSSCSSEEQAEDENDLGMQT